MNWVREREEWLAAWDDAACLKVISFCGFGISPPSRDAAGEVFFSEVVEAGDTCLICRASGSVVDVFDVSPGASRLVSWCVQLTAPVMPHIGISVCRDAGGVGVNLMFLTRELTIHAVDVVVRRDGQAPELNVGLSARAHEFGQAQASTASGSPTSFCALGRDLAAIGCLGGGIHVWRLREDGSRAAYELATAPFLQRLVGGLLGPSPQPAVLALATAGTSGGHGLWLLSYSANGRLQLWEAGDRSGQLVASADTGRAGDVSADFGGEAQRWVSIRVSDSRAKACVVSRCGIYLVELPSTQAMVGSALPVREVASPFAGSAPVMAALSHGALWGLWSDTSRDQLFRFDLERPDVGMWEACALDASLLHSDDVAAHPALRAVAVEGCGSAILDPKCVFSLHQQLDVWRSEEEAFDPIGAAAQLGAASGEREIINRALRWWTCRVLLPGRFLPAAIEAALLEGGGPHAIGGAGASTDVEAHLRRLSGLPAGRDADIGGASVFTVMDNLAKAASGFIRECEAASVHGRQLCGLATSSVWAPHMWYPAGDSAASIPEVGARACAMLLYRGGVSCVRTMHTWSERWWATCNLSRHLSNYVKVELENLLELSGLAEWKLCVTGWLLAQSIGSANLGWALSALSSDAPASAAVRRLATSVPEAFQAHIKRCIPVVDTSGGVAAGSLSRLLRTACGPADRQVTAFGRSLDILHGVRGAKAPSVDEDACRLCDVLRGGIAACEAEHLVIAMRDLALVSAYLAPLQKDPSAWRELTDELDRHVPLYVSLHTSMTLPVQRGCPPGLRTPAAGLWASAFRTESAGRLICARPPVASFRAFEYAMRLLRRECWSALREWCAHQDVGTLSSYIAAREWLAAGRAEAAASAFVEAEGAAGVVAQCLGGIAGELLEARPPRVAYYAHVAGLCGARNFHADEYRFLRKAAQVAADEPDVSGLVRHRLWCAVFDKAVCLKMLGEACQVLEHIDSIEGHVEPRLETLARELRRAGRSDLIMGMPDRLKGCFISDLHRAAKSPPTPGSDSLICYQHLYALHFSAQEYVQAARVAHSLYLALDTSPGGASALADAEAPGVGDTLAVVASGDSLSLASDVPRRCGSQLAPSPVVAAPSGAIDMLVDAGAGLGAQAWPILDLQRSALLMLSNALSLTPDKAILVPASRTRDEAPTMAHAGVALPPLGGIDLRPSRLEQLLQQAPSAWPAPDAGARDGGLLTTTDVERFLATVEARLVLCGGTGAASADHSSDLRAGSAAKRVAELGLLALALRVVRAHGLDAWHLALRPFLEMCLEAEADGCAESLAEYARGPAQAHMFVRSDAGEPLGANGKAMRGWWQTFEAGLRSVGGFDPSGRLDARGCRLYTLAAADILEKQPTAPLPKFLTDQLSNGPSWVALLRVYMKHAKLTEAVDLLREQLKASERDFVSLNSKRLRWTPLRDFPMALAEHLRRGIDRALDRGDPKDQLKALASDLDRILVQVAGLMEDASQTPAC